VFLSLKSGRKINKVVTFKISIMKKLSFLLLIVVLFGCKRNQNKTEIIQGSTAFWGHKFSEATDVKYGIAEEQRLDIYSQGQWIGEPNYWKSDSINHPTLVYIHGGGWLGGSKDHVTPFIIAYLQKGWNVVNVEYRTGQGTAPLAVDDCMLAMQWLAYNAKSYNIDREQVVISGESAGGHLALITGMLNSIPGSHKYYSGKSLKIKAIVNWFGITDIAGVDNFYKQQNQESNFAILWVGNPQRMDSVSKVFSPVNRITSSTPAIISIHGRKDSVVPYEQAVTFHELLKKAGIRNELVTIDDGKHLGFTDKEYQYIYTRIFDFLGQQK
jgi:acetyl esterase/lipase